MASPEVYIYISRCDGAPCGESTIHLVKGADSSHNQELRASALVFLKGTVASKERLKKEKANNYELIEQVWEIRNRHMVKNVPSQYIFLFEVLPARGMFPPSLFQPVQTSLRLVS